MVEELVEFSGNGIHIIISIVRIDDGESPTQANQTVWSRRTVNPAEGGFGAAIYLVVLYSAYGSVIRVGQEGFYCCVSGKILFRLAIENNNLRVPFQYLLLADINALPDSRLATLMAPTISKTWA